MSFAAANRAKAAARKKSLTSVVAKAAGAMVATPPFPPAPKLHEEYKQELDDLKGAIDLRDDEGPRWELLPVDRIDPSPHNPRKTFDPDTLKDLSESIKRDGLLQPIIVLPEFNGRWEIAYGERRYRAAKQAGLKMVPCLIQDAAGGDPVGLDLARLAENRDREDLNPIDEAKAFQRFLKPKADGGHGLTQIELANKLGVTQSHVSNRVRLLALPKRCQDLIISGEMSVENGRMLATWCDVPAVIDQLEKAPNSELTAAEWRLKQVLYKACPDLRRLPPAVLEKHKAALKPRTLKDDYSTTQLATGDIELAQRLLREQLAKDEARWASKGTGQKGKLKDDPAAAEKEAAKRRAEVYNKKLYRYRVEWLRDLLIERVETIDIEWLWRWTLVLAARSNGTPERFRAMEDATSGEFRKDEFKALASRDPAYVVRVAMKEWLAVDVTRHSVSVTPDEIEAMAAQVGIDMEKLWRLDDAFIGLHNAEQLAGLWKELGLEAETQTSIPPTAKRSFAVEKFVAAKSAKKRPYPKCLKTVKPVSLT